MTVDGMIMAVLQARDDEDKIVEVIADIITKLNSLRSDCNTKRFEYKRSEMIYDVNRQTSLLSYLDKGWKVTDARARCEQDCEADRGAMLEYERIYHDSKAELETYEDLLDLCMKLLKE